MNDIFTLIVDRSARLIYANEALEELSASLRKTILYKSAGTIFSKESVNNILFWWKKSVHKKAYLDLKFASEVNFQGEELLEWTICPIVSQRGEEGMAVLTASCPGEVETTDISHLLQITELMNASQQDGAILEKLSEFIHKTLNHYHVAVYLLNDNILEVKANCGTQVQEQFRSVDINFGIIGKTAYKGEAIVINDVRKCSFYNKSIPETLSEVAVPIKTPSQYEGQVTDNVIGVLNVESQRINAFSHADVIKLKAIANTLAIAVENGSLMDRVLSLLKTESLHSQEQIHKKAELDEFIHTISHDLRNPLNNIAGFTDLLKDELGDAVSVDVKKYFSRIKANIDTVSRLINDLLELSRVGRMDQAFTPVPMSELVKEIQYDLKATDDCKDLDLQFSNLPETVYGNRHRITQLMTNLVGNAYKYRHSNRIPKVVISCSESPKEYCFAVKDNGIGISEKHMGSIFVFGFRVREIDVEGSGAGLAISKKIVEAHGGRMWVDSLEGEGSTFYFTISK